MAGFIDHEKAFISLFNQTARYHHRHKVFEDFVSCSVIALENRLCFSEKREAKYLRIIGGYEKPDVVRMAQLLAHVVNGLQNGFCDFLGNVFMQLELGDKYRGQFFTPWDVARMMAQLQLGDVKAMFDEKPFITLSEPACGAGCMVLAFADALNQAGYASHRYLWVSATDIDPLAAGMAYIQLSLCGVAGEVVIGNALFDERRRVLLTPGHYLGGWSSRLHSLRNKVA
ncbi:SAM-dependent DNA methyltransferase [Klebsiella michiganensis]|uniref:SAM-dependent DNA methyltransferase n=1 Tax=Klebsiella michiganensis TaxID=1134687 RepID=A0A6P1UYR5_9ENTR|nr:N-6 DNA methylase [Klebsiella michiganensis]QHS47533.1 SAM-dependent DNA methyltransferase [Klebsiella michiganensis]HDX8936677.1 SAM-dependent DNA methyltransferase [Klebsiella michiganensis]